MDKELHVFTMCEVWFTDVFNNYGDNIGQQCKIIGDKIHSYLRERERQEYNGLNTNYIKTMSRVKKKQIASWSQ
mgnify:FL=1